MGLICSCVWLHLKYFRTSENLIFEVPVVTLGFYFFLKNEFSCEAAKFLKLFKSYAPQVPMFLVYIKSCLN